MSAPSTYRPLIDRLGLSASAACAVHCALLPMLVGALPALGLGFLSHGPFEVFMVSLSCVLGLASVIRSWRLHRRLQPIMMMTLGVAVLLFATVGTHLEGVISEELHPWLAATAGLIIAGAHLVTIRLCRHCEMCEHEHDGVHSHETETASNPLRAETV